MKKIAFLLAIVMILTLFSGCHLLKPPAKDPPKPVWGGEKPSFDLQSQGGYVEKDLYTSDAPYSVESINRFGDNGLRVFCYPDEFIFGESAVMPEYFVSRFFEWGEDFTTEEVSWWDIIPGAYDKKYIPMGIGSSKDGAIYTFAHEYNEVVIDTTLYWKTVYMGETSEFTHTIKDNENYWQVAGLYPISDSRIVSLYCGFSTGFSATIDALILILDTESGEVIYSDEFSMPYKSLTEGRKPGVVAVSDNCLFYIDGDDILEISAENGKELSRTQKPDTEISYLITPTEDTIFYLDKSGINALPIGGDTPELIVEASRHSFGSPEWMTSAAIRGSEGNFYLLLISRSGRGCRVVKYSYDQNLALLPQKKVTLTDLSDCYVVKLAVDIFRNEHPEIALEYTQLYDFMDEEYKPEGKKKSRFDYFNQLKNDIMSGDFSDVVIAPAGVFKGGIDKGLFLELGDKFDDDIPKAVGNALANDKGRFGAPLNIRLPIIYGKPADLDKIKDLDSLISYCETAFPAVEYTQPETLFDTAYIYYADRLNSGMPDEKLIEDFMKDTEKLVLAATSPENLYYDLTGRDIMGLHFMGTGVFGPDKTYFTGETETVFPIAIVFSGNIPDFIYSLHGFKMDEETMFNVPYPLKDYSLKLLRPDVFLPVDAAVINAKTEVPDEARAFVEFLYSDYQTDNYTYDYFPLSPDEANERKEHFDKLIFNEEYYNLKGGFKPYEYDFEPLYDNLKTPILIDYERHDILFRNTVDYVFGGAPLEKAVFNALNELKYLE